MVSARAPEEALPHWQCTWCTPSGVTLDIAEGDFVAVVGRPARKIDVMHIMGLP